MSITPLPPVPQPGDSRSAFSAKMYAFLTALHDVFVGEANGLTTASIQASIVAAPGKTTPVDADTLGLVDSAGGNALKSLTWANVKATLWAAWGALISAGTAKTTPVDADALALMDSAAGNATKKITLANLSAWFLARVSTWTAKQTFNGFTVLGDTSPSIKLKKITGTVSSTAGVDTSVAHGLTYAKISGIQVTVDVAGLGTPPNVGVMNLVGYQYNAYFNSTYVVLTTHASNSGNITGRSFSALITYEE